MEQKKLTGYPSIDKPWLKYYSEEAINAPLPGGTACEFIWEMNKNTLGDTALVYYSRKISYKRLFEYIDRAAAAFSSLGVGKGDIVAMALPNIPENTYCVYALNKLGAIADMIDLRAKGDTLLHYLQESEAKVAVICTLFAENMFAVLSQTRLEKLIVVSPFESLPAPLKAVKKRQARKIRLPECAIEWEHFMRLSKASVPMSGSGDDVACIFHTSGTTDLPKGVMMTNMALNAMTVQYRYGGMDFSSGDTFFNHVPPFLAYTFIMATHLPFALHMTIFMLPDYQPQNFVKNVMKLKPNHAAAGPADWNNFLENEDAKKGNFSFLKMMGSGSDTMRPENKTAVNHLVQERGAKYGIMEGYGMTEIGSAACTNVPQHDVMGSVGIPLSRNNFCIYDNENECELPYNEVGEICMTGPTVMKGYYKMPDETAKVLRKHKDGTVWLHSGDLGYISEDGDVYLEGRIKRIIIRHDGIKVSPFSLEKTIMKHPNAVACCVVGRFDTVHQRGQVPVAYIVLKKQDADSLEEIKALCEKHLSSNYLPYAYKIISALPLTQNGKVDYRALEQMAADTKKE